MRRFFSLLFLLYLSMSLHYMHCLHCSPAVLLLAPSTPIVFWGGVILLGLAYYPPWSLAAASGAPCVRAHLPAHEANGRRFIDGDVSLGDILPNLLY